MIRIYSMRIACAGFFSAILSAGLCAGGVQPALIDFDWSEDFEHGTIAGWSSYPPFQDTAYDYSILAGSYRPPQTLQGYVASGEFFYPVNLPAPQGGIPNQFYLLRAYRPNSVARQRVGVTRKTSLYVSENSVLRFEYWTSPGETSVFLVIELAGADGNRYRTVRQVIGQGEWTPFTAPLVDFECDGKSPPPGLEIQAVVILAQFERGNPSAVHYFAVDNLRLNGKRRAGFVLESPQAEIFDHWPLALAKRRIGANDVLNVAAISEVPINRALARLERFEGTSVCPERELRLEKSMWTAEGFHTFSDRDPTGPLKLVLEGQTEEGHTIKTEVRLWRLPQTIGSDRPHLLLTPTEMDRLKARKESGRGKVIWDRIRDRAAVGRKKSVPRHGQVEEFPKDYLIQQLVPYFEAVRNTAYDAMLNAWVYALEGDEEAGGYAKDAALKMAGWETWTHPWFLTQGRKTYYPVGLAAMNLGIAYDLIRPLLSMEEAAAIRSGVIQNGIVNAYDEYFLDNRVPNHTSNWISHCTAGPLVALLAFDSDAKGHEAAESERLFFGLAEKFLVHCKATFTADGGYGEGYGYQNFTLESASPFLAAMENLFGANDLAHSLNIAKSYLNPLYISVNDGETLLDMGDSSDSAGVRTNWAWLSNRLEDPLLKGFYQSNPGDDWEDFLWFEDNPHTSDPQELPPSRFFPNKGNVVFRTGWQQDDVVLNFRAGPHFNHTHADQGSFRLWAFGEELVAEAGKAGYYTDPYYWSYFIQAGGHNTILADGISESQEFGDFENEVRAFDRRARIKQVRLAERLSLVTSDLAPVYRGSTDGHLQRFERTLCLVDPGYVVVWDRLRSVGNQTYQWQLFPPQAEGFSIEGTTARYRGDKAEIEVNVLWPDDAALTALERPIEMGRYSKYPGEPLQPRVALQVDGGAASEGLEFLVVLYPRRIGEEAAAHVRKIHREGGVGIRVEARDWTDEIEFDGTRDRVLFLRTAGERLIAADEIPLSASSE